MRSGSRTRTSFSAGVLPAASEALHLSLGDEWQEPGFHMTAHTCHIGAFAAPLISRKREGCGVENASSLQHELADLHPKSFGWALACCRYDRNDAEEVLQTSYLKVLSGRARFDRRSRFKTWLFGVIRRTAQETRRRQLEVLELVFYQDLSIQEAAAVMRVSLGTARVHYERGKKNLREALARRGRRGTG